MNETKPPRRSLLPIGSSPLIRVAVVLGGLLILLVLFLIIKGLFGHSNIPALVTVAQDQQEIIHLTTNPGQQKNGPPASLSVASQNFAITAKLSITSAQSDLIQYMQNNGKKVKPKTLSLKVSKNLDDQLTGAIANNTYDQLFKQTMQNKLGEYEQALKIAYKETKGPKGRTLLSNDYNSAQLLLQQLNSPAE